MVEVISKPTMAELREKWVYYRVEGRREFIEANFRIVDKELRLVPFKFKPTQELYWAGRTLRDRMLKFRQGMFSSIVTADLIAEAMLVPGLTCMVMVQKPEEESIRKHRERAKMFHESTDEAFRPPLLVDSLHQMQLGFPGRMTSTVYFGSAGSLSLGRGETLNRVVREELGEWEDEEVEASSGMLLGLPPGSRVIDLGTPKRVNTAFHRLWQATKQPRSVYKGHLFRWHQHHEYQLSADDPFCPPHLRGDMALDDQEAQLVLEWKLSMDQIRWRRQKVEEAGSIQAFWQEYLEDDFRCWSLPGGTAMPTQVIDRLLAMARPPLPAAAMPCRDYGGALRMWLPPHPGENYVIMADPAGGKATGHTSAAVVRRARDWVHCASLEGFFTPGELGGVMVEMGRVYNGALLGWERNFSGAGLEERVMRQMNYPAVYMHMQNPSGAADGLPGFVTTWRSKADLVQKVSEMMLAGEWSSWDSRLLGEYRNMTFHDDKNANPLYETRTLNLAMADLLCVAAADQAPHQRRARAGQDAGQSYFIPRYLRRD